MIAVSLFSCGGVSDLALKKIGFNVITASELILERAEVYKYNFPETNMIVGDIWEKKNKIVEDSLNYSSHIDLVIATPPCQGMSKSGKSSRVKEGRTIVSSDPRNLLIIPTMYCVEKISPDVFILENVPEIEHTYIVDPKDNSIISIMEYVCKALGSSYHVSKQVIDFANYGVPQRRQRYLAIFTKKMELINRLKEKGSLFPRETHSKTNENGKKRWLTVRDCIGSFPKLDAKNKELAKNNHLNLHEVPVLKGSKYLWVSNTPEGKSAFDNQCINHSCLYQGNDVFPFNKKSTDQSKIYCSKCGSLLPRPIVKENNKYRLMKGFETAYSRMDWDKPAPTITTLFSYVCSNRKIHPDQNRALSMYEAIHLQTISDFPFFFQRADKLKLRNTGIRDMIGESIPPRGLLSILEHVFNDDQNISANPTQKNEGQLSLF